MDSETRALLQRLLKYDEGLSLRPYLCPRGWLTIGWGHNLGLYGLTSAWNAIQFPHTNTISIEAADQLFEDDIEAAYSSLKNVVGHELYSSLSTTRRVVLLAMVFNLGESGFRSFKRMLAALRAGDTDKIRHEMLDSAWAAQLPGRAEKYAQAFHSNLFRRYDHVQ